MVIPMHLRFLPARFGRVFHGESFPSSVDSAEVQSFR